MKLDFICIVCSLDIYILFRKYYCVMIDLEILNMYMFFMLVVFLGEVNWWM